MKTEKKRELLKILNEISVVRGPLKSMEMALFEYTHKNPLVRWLFWKRLDVCLEFAGLNRKKTVVDFGCGSGILLPHLSGNSKMVYGVDLDLSIAKQVVKKFNLKNVKLIKNIKKAESADAILCLDVLEHIPNTERVIKSLADKLKKGGTIIVSGPTENWFYLICRAISGSKDSGHVTDIGKIRKMFENSEMQIIRKRILPVPVFSLFKIYCFKK